MARPIHKSLEKLYNVAAKRQKLPDFLAPNIMRISKYQQQWFASIYRLCD